MIRPCHAAALFLPLILAAASPPPEPKIRAVPTGSPGGWFSDADYPADARRQELDGTTGFRLDIDPTGKTINCTITSSSGVASLDNVTCAKLLERARFTPAKDAKGKAVADTYTGRITWRLPDSDGIADLPPLPYKVVTEFTVNPDGMPSDCSTVLNGEPVPDDQNCIQQVLVKRYPVEQDASGKPVRYKLRSTMSFEKIVE